MTTHFDRWEKDPFFSAAEEVQESSDRMESTYRTWLHSKKDTSGLWNSDEVRRDLQTALGTTKWQLEEFERAVNSSYRNSLVDDSRDRHRDFIIAIESQVEKVEKSLNESSVSLGKPPLPWVRLDEGERNELALFLSGPSAASSVDKNLGRFLDRDQQAVNLAEADKQSAAECSKDLSDALELGRLEAKENLPGHRRTASAGADIGAWKIAVSDGVSPPSLSNEKPGPPPRKIPSLSGFLNKMESASKLKWPKNGYRKLKPMDGSQEAEMLPRSQHPTRGCDACYERSKSCLNCGGDCYNKQIDGWYGALQRQLQRSQYHMQYSRPVQVVFLIVVLICIIVLLVLHAA